MAKKRESRRKVKTLAAKKARSAEEKGVKGGYDWHEDVPQTEGPRLQYPSGRVKG
jgi:hypothetical protein